MKEPLSKEQFVEKAIERRNRLLRQINDWIHDGNIYEVDYSTAIGLPTNHIILQRRLEQYLFELGRKRQKFINHSDYEKHQFLEKQKRKSSALRRCLSVSDRSSRGWTVGASQGLLTREDSSLTQGMTPGGNQKYDDTDDEPKDSFLITQMYSEKDLSKTRIGLMTDARDEVTPPKPISRGKSVQFMQTSLYNTTAHLKPKNERSEPIQPSLTKPPNLERIPSIMRERSNSLPTPAQVPWSLMKSTSIAPNSHLPPLMSDPRYAKLEKALCSTYEDEKFARTASVVKQLDSLHVSPKSINKRKSEVERKIRQFLAERGLIG